MGAALRAVEGGRLKPEPTRVELRGALEGYHALFDPDELTFGILEDFESGKARLILDALAVCLCGGDLPHGTERAGLRRLLPDQVKALIEGVTEAYSVPKSSP